MPPLEMTCVESHVVLTVMDEAVYAEEIFGQAAEPVPKLRLGRSYSSVIATPIGTSPASDFRICLA